ncbi:MAG: hypothetical protein Q8L74_12950 [Nitrospirota bacterium]|nr:hypothetical protein [Nitrospirota bacterium]
MNEIQVYSIGRSAPYARGLTTKSTSVRHGSALDEHERRCESDALQELTAFILARHPPKRGVSLQFGKARRTKTLDSHLLSEWTD